MNDITAGLVVYSVCVIFSLIFYSLSDFRRSESQDSSLHRFNDEIQKLFTYFILGNAISFFFLIWYFISNFLINLSVSSAIAIVAGVCISLSVILSAYGLISVFLQSLSESKKLNRNLEKALLELRNVNFNVKQSTIGNNGASQFQKRDYSK